MTQLPRRRRWHTAPRRLASLPGARRRWPSWPHASRSAAHARAWSPGESRPPRSSAARSRPSAYWGRPVPGWGDERPRVLIVGLAPAAHGGNRTGRIFTGDRSGDWLFGSLHRCGLAAQPQSVAAGDGQRLLGARMAAAVRCAPPANRPSPQERDTCAPWLAAELGQVADCVRVIVALGGFAWQASWPALRAAGFVLPRPRPPFGHGREVGLAGRCGGPAGAFHRLLPPQPAEHVHRPRHPRHARRCLPAGEAGCLPGPAPCAPDRGHRVALACLPAAAACCLPAACLPACLRCTALATAASYALASRPLSCSPLNHHYTPLVKSFTSRGCCPFGRCSDRS